jgi:tRNA A-37 threonylcarbamoyl transferase component Bud32
MWLIAVETTGEMRLVAILRLTMEATRGLIHLHKHDIVHCDIAARNILVSNSHDKTLPQRATINDLGLARYAVEL